MINRDGDKRFCWVGTRQSKVPLFHLKHSSLFSRSRHGPSTRMPVPWVFSSVLPRCSDPAPNVPTQYLGYLRGTRRSDSFSQQIANLEKTIDSLKFFFFGSRIAMFSRQESVCVMSRPPQQPRFMQRQGYMWGTFPLPPFLLSGTRKPYAFLEYSYVNLVK